MKKALKRAVAIMLTIVTLTSSIYAFANFTTGALITNEAEGYNWMSKIKDSTMLCDISIPGSHDSGAMSTEGYASPWAKTQSLSISEQLNAGVRCLDLRLRYNADVTGKVQIVHSSINTYDEAGNILTLDTVISTLYVFLATHPTETVIVSFKEDDGNNESSIVQAINSYITKNSSRWYQSYNTPTLAQARGKIVVATRMSTLKGIGLNSSDQGSDGGYTYDYYKNLYFQDRYNMGTENKWENAAKPLLDFKKPNGAWSINYLSTTGSNINGVSSNANIMNQHFNDYCATNNKCYGIIMFDYVSDGLCKKVFKCNDLVANNQPNPKEGQYYYRLNWNTNTEVSSGWSSVYLKINYRKNNGTGASSSVLLFDQSDQYNGYQFVCNAENFDFSGWLPGYPTSVEFHYDFGYGSHTLDVNQRLYIGKSPDSELKLVASNDFKNSSYVGRPCVGTEYYYVSPMAEPSTVEFTDTSDLYVDVPKLNASEYTSIPLECDVLDQYGVSWYDNNYSISLDKNYTGVRVSGKEIIIDQAANALQNETEIYATARYSTSSSTITSRVKKRIVLSVSSIPYKFVNEDGSVLQEGVGTIGDIIEYNGAAPKKSATSTHHYTFNGFTNNTGLSEENNIFTATYIEEAHIKSSSLTYQYPTCTEDGISFASCECGTYWNEPIPALGHYYLFNNENCKMDIHFDCKYCNEQTIIAKNELKSLWDAKYVNERKIERAGADNSNLTSMLDMNKDKIINGKDYAMINYLTKYQGTL